MHATTRHRASALLCALALWPVLALAQGYQVTDLGALNGDNSWAWGLNGRGDVAGWSTASGPTTEAFIWTERRGLRGLGQPPGSSVSYGLGIDDSGRVAGYAGLSFEDSHAFRWDRRQGLVVLDTLGGAQAWARGINGRGEIVGEADTATGERHLVVWGAVGVQDLGTLPGETLAEGVAINALGQVVGNGPQAFLWRDGDFVPLPSLGGKRLARGLNDLGHAVGSAALGTGGCPTCDTRAALWRDGAVRDLGTLAPPGTPAMSSVAHGINNAGDIVGWSTIAGLGSHHGFVCRGGCPGGLADLNTLVPAGWTINEAYAINGAGQIAATGYFSPGGLLRGLLLTPDDPHLMALTPRPGVAGRINRIELRWATPGATVRLFAGAATGQTAVADCAATIDLAEATLLGEVQADSHGGATLRVRIPAAQRGQPLYVQALDLARCRLGTLLAHRFE